jgi:hypothetical protein
MAGWALRLKRAFTDGTEAIIFAPGELIEKLVVLVARPRTHGITYHGVLAPIAAIRSEIVPQPDQAAGPQLSAGPEERKPPAPGRRPWADLLKRVFLVAVLDCPKCHGRMRILAVIMKAEVLERILGNLGLPTEPPRVSPPRAASGRSVRERDGWPLGRSCRSRRLARLKRRLWRFSGTGGGLSGARGEACASGETSLFSPRGAAPRNLARSPYTSIARSNGSVSAFFHCFTPRGSMSTLRCAIAPCTDLDGAKAVRD